MRIVRCSGVPDPATLRDAADCIAAGGTLIFPTETVYGIGCDPDNARAVDAVFRAKRRPAHKPLAIHVAIPEEAEEFAAFLTPSARRIMTSLWPGPVAIIVKRVLQRASPAALGADTISLRCPNDETCSALLRATGPLAATSANISGDPAFTGEEAGLDSLPSASMAIITGPTRLRQESTVVDCTSDTPRIVRLGAVDRAAIEAAR